MSKFRVLDGAAAGYMREPLGEVGKSSADGAAQRGSPVISEAWAQKYIGYTPTVSAPAAQSYARWRIIGAVATIHGGAVCNEIELWSGADGTGTKYPLQSAASTNNYNPNALINGLTTENQSADMDYLYSALGSFYQVNMASPQPVKSIRFFQFLDVPASSWYRKYYIDRVHVEASNDGTIWTRILTDVDLTSPRNALSVINL
jgi:hypothetical protein